MTAVSVLKRHKNGIRPVAVRYDLRQIADLIELCFADRMDRSGQMAIAEMRSMANLGVLLYGLQAMDKLLRGIVQGFVWEEDGHIVGNVSLYRAGHSNAWVIANVAVHPDYRGRGLGYQLCAAALERIVEFGGSQAILQVDEDNPPAVNIYEQLGFVQQRTFVRWFWGQGNRVAKPLPDMPKITYAALHDWRAVYALAQRLRPDALGGLGWLRPTHESVFRPSLGRSLGRLFSPSSKETWVIRGQENPLDAIMFTESSFGASSIRFDLLVHPDKQGQLELFLLNYLLRRAGHSLRGAYTDHPADDFATTELLQRHNFQHKRALIHMRWDAK